MTKQTLNEQLRLDLDGDSDYDLDTDSNTTNELILKGLEEIRQALLPLDDRLWTIKDVAAYMGVSQATARRAMSPTFGAPLPIRIPTRKDSMIPDRWVASEVRRFCETQKRSKRKRPVPVY